MKTLTAEQERYLITLKGIIRSSSYTYRNDVIDLLDRVLSDRTYSGQDRSNLNILHRVDWIREYLEENGYDV